jgi:TRAP-type mannitol/chloroaromatic compound transport system permease small subunit
MPGAIVTYVRVVEAVNRFFGRIAMYGIFAMIAVLLWSSISKMPGLSPSLWTLEMAQFLMVSYYLLGGGYSMQMESHVRMDLLYGRWNRKRKGFTDTITSFCLIFYLVLLLYGGVSSSEYAIFYGETSYSSWSPYMWPVKIVMTFGIFLMLLQAVATLIRDVAAARGMTIEGEPLDEQAGEASS